MRIAVSVNRAVHVVQDLGLQEQSLIRIHFLSFIGRGISQAHSNCTEYVAHLPILHAQFADAIAVAVLHGVVEQISRIWNENLHIGRRYPFMHRLLQLRSLLHKRRHLFDGSYSIFWPRA